MPTKRSRTRSTTTPAPQTTEILDVHMTAALLTVSPDTVYDLFKTGELPGRKVGRKWLRVRRARRLPHEPRQVDLAGRMMPPRPWGNGSSAGYWRSCPREHTPAMPRG
jgi:excisionase family DNA binding protein